MARKKLEYALYKGDDCLGIGTIEELAKQMGVNEHTIRYYQTPQYKRRGRGEKSKKRRVLIKLDWFNWKTRRNI